METAIKTTNFCKSSRNTSRLIFIEAPTLVETERNCIVIQSPKTLRGHTK